MSNPEMENAGAAATAPGAMTVVEAGQLLFVNTASLVARHPIIALHWGFAA